MTECEEITHIYLTVPAYRLHTGLFCCISLGIHTSTLVALSILTTSTYIQDVVLQSVLVAVPSADTARARRPPSACLDAASQATYRMLTTLATVTSFIHIFDI